jgi:aspartate/methionine/tyrosine aminotransferase
MMLLRRLPKSPTLEMMYRTIEMKSRGLEVYSLAAGEPYFPTPAEIVEVAHRAMLEGQTHYVEALGTRAVRDAIARKVRRLNGIHAEPDDVAFMPNKYALAAALQAVVSRGMEVLVPDPGYFYSEAVTLAGGRPIRYRLSDDFSLDIDEIRRRTGDRTRAIVVNTPSNPTARVFERSALEELYEFARDRGIRVLSDEAYEDVIFEGTHFSMGSLEDSPDTVISVFSLSKSFSMTGWRAGYVVASRGILSLIKKYVEHTMSCFPPFIQAAAAYALDNQERLVAPMKDECARRRKIVVEALEGIDGLEVNRIEGTFYAFPKYGLQVGSVKLAEMLLREQRVAVVPGIGFGPSGEGRFRISFCQREEELLRGLEGLRAFFRQHGSG